MSESVDVGCLPKPLLWFVAQLADFQPASQMGIWLAGIDDVAFSPIHHATRAVGDNGAFQGSNAGASQFRSFIALNAALLGQPMISCQ
jgi:hypothetical protein